MSNMDNEIINKHRIWLSVLLAISTFSILRLSRVLDLPFWQGILAAIVVALIIYRTWFAIRKYRLKKLKSSLKGSIKSKS